MNDNVFLSKEEPELDAEVRISVGVRGMNEPVILPTTYEWAMGFHSAWVQFVKGDVSVPIASVKVTTDDGCVVHFALSEVTFVGVAHG